MATMNTYGYHYDMASETGNKYSLIIDGREVIRDGTYLSVLSNFKHISNYYRARNVEAHIVMKKTFDGKTSVNKIVREFNNWREF